MTIALVIRIAILQGRLYREALVFSVMVGILSVLVMLGQFMEPAPITLRMEGAVLVAVVRCTLMVKLQ